VALEGCFLPWLHPADGFLIWLLLDYWISCIPAAIPCVDGGISDGCRAQAGGGREPAASGHPAGAHPELWHAVPTASPGHAAPPTLASTS